jgi:hypothetical protein
LTETSEFDACSTPKFGVESLVSLHLATAVGIYEILLQIFQIFPVPNFHPLPVFRKSMKFFRAWPNDHRNNGIGWPF